MAGTTVTENEVLAWFLGRVNAAAGKHPYQAHLNEILERRSTPALMDAFAAPLMTTLATATGALVFRTAPTKNSWGQRQISHRLENFDPKTAARGSEAYALSLLLDETKPYCRLLGRCQVCGRYFIAADSPQGQKPTAYCSDEHRIEGTRAKTLERVRRHRAKPPNSQARKKP